MAKLFQKPVQESKEQLAKLQSDIFEAMRRVEGIDAEFAEKYRALDIEFLGKKSEKQKELDALENILGILRAERVELEKPIEHKRKELAEREVKIVEKEKSLTDQMQKAFEREREADTKLEDVQSLSDELGETRVRQMTKEKLLKGREDALKDRESAHLVKIERFSHEVNEAAARIQERENALFIKESTVQGKEENLVKRKKELLDGYILLNDRRGALERAWRELELKQHGKSQRTSRHSS